MLDTAITGATVIDGTGASGVRADVGIRDGRIVAVGELDGPATETIDAEGLVVCPGFVDVLKNTIDAVNEVQQAAGKKKREFEAGVGEADLAEVMIAVNKADLSFRAMTEVRNKLVNAYQEIMNMPV